jgi:hypothetical protein
VIRLVTQFDDVETRASIATPTCGGCCCCCCCCVTTAVGVTAFTAMNLRKHARALEQTAGASPSPWAEVVGALALPLALIVAGGVAAAVHNGAASLLAVPAWILILFGLYRWVRAPGPWVSALLTVVFASIAAVVEFFLGAALLFGAGFGIYAVLTIVASIAVVVIEHRALLRRGRA